ncbi:MAG: hypothetical protein OEV40_21165 [Acidimicrobiia bacterium]|nr:hypothetical protein [Acidimicrobiia bacterium]
MKSPQPIVFYVPKISLHRDARRPDIVGALELVGANGIERWAGDRYSADWGGVEVIASLGELPEHLRLILQLRALDWLDITEVDEYGALVEPGRLRRLVHAFAEACDALDCDLAAKFSDVLPEHWVEWDRLYPTFDRLLEAKDSVEVTLRADDFGFANRRLTQFTWATITELGKVDGFLNGFETEKGYVWFNDETPPAWPLPEWSYDRVYSAPAASGWPHKWWGLWPHVHFVRTGREDIADHLDDYRDESVPQAIQSFMADYLQATPPALVASENRLNPARCDLCDDPVPINRFHSDDVWWWPGDLGHYVRKHHFVLPNEMAAHIVAADGIPPDVDDLTADLDELPWPPKVFPDDPPWPHQAAEEGDGWRVFHPDGSITEPDGTITRPNPDLE